MIFLLLLLCFLAFAINASAIFRGNSFVLFFTGPLLVELLNYLYI